MTAVLMLTSNLSIRYHGYASAKIRGKSHNTPSGHCINDDTPRGSLVIYDFMPKAKQDDM